MTVDEAYNALVAPLKNIYQEREAVNIADWVFESITGMSRLKRVTTRSVLLDISISNILQDTLSRLMKHEPVQYILNEAWFFKLKFYVNENVLIPRPETEELIEWITDEVKMINRSNDENLTILDIGTGSGCIAISLKKELPGAIISSIDISETALTVAKRNAEYHKVNIDFGQIDFLSESEWESLEQYDIIISNPPYIPGNEKIMLDKNVVNYEPHLALFVENEDAFIFYRKIIAFSHTHLHPDGKIYVEIHEDYSKDVAEIFCREGFKAAIKKDIHGRNRMISASR